MKKLRIRLVDEEFLEPGKHYLVIAEQKQGVEFHSCPAELEFYDDETHEVMPVEILP